ncbi:MAG: hypothetical protein MJE66_25765 [Proteobacteria bacterium]|nr:hypothetical protein [Pseudomonadota bacterium]
MGRPLRRHAPGELYLVTTRCFQARFLLRPDPQLNQAVLEWLTRAQQVYPRVRLHAVCAMSNHLHLVVRDENGELAAWASYFLGNLARTVNRLRRRSGAVFERRYSAEPILDAEALIDRIVYVATNPVKAFLVSTAQRWPGVLLFAPAASPVVFEVTWTDRQLLRGSRNDPSETTVRGQLRVDPLSHPGAPPPDIATAVTAREREIAAARRAAGRKPMSRRQLMGQPWHRAPREPRRAPRPLCHAADAALRRAFRDAFEAFTSLFREASECLRRGMNSVFPPWSYPPGGTLVRPAPG